MEKKDQALKNLVYGSTNRISRLQKKKAGVCFKRSGLQKTKGKALNKKAKALEKKSGGLTQKCTLQAQGGFLKK